MFHNVARRSVSGRIFQRHLIVQARAKFTPKKTCGPPHFTMKKTANPTCQENDGTIIEVTSVETASLHPHPLNKQVYGDEPDEAFVDDVQDNGVITPLLVTTHKLIVSGHRRWQAAVGLKLATVPARIVSEDDADTIEQLLLAANLQRDKSTEQRLREFELYLHLEAKAARARQGQRTDIGETFPESSKGRARTTAAAKVGFSDRTAERGWAVLKALEERSETENAQELEEILTVLNVRGVEPAYQRVVGLGWIEKPTPRTTQPPKASDSTQRSTSSLSKNVLGSVQAAPDMSATTVGKETGGERPGPPALILEPQVIQSQPTVITTPTIGELFELADGTSLELPRDGALSVSQLRTGLARLTRYGRNERDGGAMSAIRLATIQRYFVGLAGTVNAMEPHGLDADDQALIIAALRALADTIENSTQA